MGERVGHESHVTTTMSVDKFQSGSLIGEEVKDDNAKANRKLQATNSKVVIESDSGSTLVGEEVDDDNVSQRGNNVSRMETNDYKSRLMKMKSFHPVTI